METKSKHEPHHHIVPILTYVWTILILFVLMISTVLIAEVKLPQVGPITGTMMNQGAALIIAVMKASLVVLIFMGVRWGTTLTKFWAMIGFTWLAFFSIIFGDYGTRKYEPVQGWEPREATALPKTIDEGTTEHPTKNPPPTELNVRPRL